MTPPYEIHSEDGTRSLGMVFERLNGRGWTWTTTLPCGSHRSRVAATYEDAVRAMRAAHEAAGRRSGNDAP